MKYATKLILLIVLSGPFFVQGCSVEKHSIDIVVFNMSRKDVGPQQTVKIAFCKDPDVDHNEADEEAFINDFDASHFHSSGKTSVKLEEDETYYVRAVLDTASSGARSVGDYSIFVSEVEELVVGDKEGQSIALYLDQKAD